MSRIKTLRTIRRVGNEEKLSPQEPTKDLRVHHKVPPANFGGIFLAAKTLRFFVAAVFTIVGNTSKIVMHLQ